MKRGDIIDVTLTLDTAPRTVTVPDVLGAALNDADVRAGWDRLSYSTQREHAEAVNGAKRPEARDKRIAAAVAAAKARMPV